MKGWLKSIIYLVAWIITQAIVLLVVTLLLKLSGSEASFLQESRDIIMMLAGSLIQLGSTLLITWLFCKFIDKIPLSEIGLKWKGKSRDFLYGCALGIVLISSGSLLLLGFGLITIESITFDGGLLLKSFILFLAVSFNEEIMARGSILRTLMESLGKYWALLVSAILFSLMHGFNSHISLIGFTNIFLAGVLLGVSYIHTKNMWFPIGLHLAWNYFQGPIWGYSVSGQEIKGIVTQKLVGSDLFTGGSFGFEASLVCTILIVVAIVVIDRLCVMPEDHLQG